MTATVTVIVLNFDGIANNYLPACLASLGRQTYPVLQLIVVDNASRDDSAGYVSRAHPDVLLVRSDQPVGFGQANNLGYARAAGEYVLFANHDTVFDPTCIQELVNAVAVADDIGMVAPKLFRPPGPGGPRLTLDSAGTLLRREFTMYDRGFGQLDQGEFETPAFIFAPCGAAAFFRGEALAAVQDDGGKLWDEDFLFYYEDGDLAWRVRNAGWRCLYYPAAIAEHHRGATMAPKFFGKSRTMRIETIKNRYLMIAKNAPARLLILNLPFLLAREIMIWGYLVLHPSLFADVVRALRGPLGRALAKRRRSSLSGSDLGLFAERAFVLSGGRPGDAKARATMQA